MGLHNLARETTTTTGTDDVVLAGAAIGCNTFVDAGVQDGETIHYGLITYNVSTHRPVDSEVGTGVFTLSTLTVSRSVIDSTQGGSKIDLTGVSEIFIAPLANDFLTVKEVDGAPSVDNVRILRVSNGTLTDDGSNQVTVDTGGGAPAGGVSFARYSESTGETVASTNTADPATLDTEDFDADSLATLAGDVLTIAATGYYVFTMTWNVAFDSALTAAGTFLMKMNFIGVGSPTDVSKTVFCKSGDNFTDATYFLNSGVVHVTAGNTLSGLFSNDCNKDMYVVIYELSIMKVG